ncbi:MAG: CbiX/SirB N-terminal domain-containing protein [Burkholderiales bacterium]
MKEAIVLFAHGSRDPAWAAPLRTLQALVAARRPGTRVELAFLEQMRPTLDEAIDAAAAARAQRVLVVPLFLAPGGHAARDLPALIATARARHPALAIRATSSIGEEAGVLAALADWIARAAA